jgi:hypothetical protein
MERKTGFTGCIRYFYIPNINIFTRLVVRFSSFSFYFEKQRGACGDGLN